MLAAVKSKGVVKALPVVGFTENEKMFESPFVLYFVHAAPNYFVVVFWTETHTWYMLFGCKYPVYIVIDPMKAEKEVKASPIES